MEDLVQQCKSRGLRNTKALRTILAILQDATLPLSLQDLEAREDVMEACDRATVFRILQRLEGIGLLRRLNFSHSGAKFSLNTGDNHKEYLICRNCGLVKTLTICCPVHSMEESVAQETGFTNMAHELTFYGLCANCQEVD